MAGTSFGPDAAIPPPQSVVPGAESLRRAEAASMPQRGRKQLPEAWDFCRRLYRSISCLRYENLSPVTIARVIKTGTLCRSSWPLLPPLMLFQYIRQTDEEMKSIEFLHSQSGSDNVLSFNDTRKVKGTGHWRLQQDLAVIHHRVNVKAPGDAAARKSSGS